MNNISPFPTPLRAVASAQPAVTTPQRALADGVTADSLRAVADWNERRGFDERRRKARVRLRGQAVALRAVADAMGGAAMARAA